MNLIRIGRVTTTHGIKGEIKILASLDELQRQEVFKVGSHLWIEHKPYTIASHRVHKGLDMICFQGFSNINDVLFLKGKHVYKDKQEITLTPDHILDDELVTFSVLTTAGKTGKIKAIEKTGNQYKILRLVIENEEVLIPYHKDFIEKIDPKEQVIIVKLL